MLDAESWVEPILEWNAPPDGAALQERLRREGELLTTWPAAPFESAATDCYRLGNQYWICQGGIGAVRFDRLAQLGVLDPAALGRAAQPSTRVVLEWVQKYAMMSTERWVGVHAEA